MVEMDERALLLGSLKGYLDELRESGVDELPYGATSAATVVGQTAAGTAAAGPPPADSTLPPIAGTGNERARLFFVTTGSGFDSPSGPLLAKIIAAMGFAAGDVFLATLPRGLAAADAPLRASLLARIQEVGPEVVVALGEAAAQLLLERRDPIAKLRGRFVDIGGVAVMATLHPDQLLADESLKRDVWNEMKQVMTRLARS